MDATYETIIESVREQMDQDPSFQVGQAIQSAFNALDELMVLATDGTTRDLVCDERIALGQLYLRCQLLASVALGRKN